MMLIGCDYHPSWQQICWLDTTTGETEDKEAGACVENPSAFIGSFNISAASRRSCFCARTSLARIFAASPIHTSCPAARAGSDRDGVDGQLPVVCGDGYHMREGRLPRIWTPSGEEKDLRQLLIHRYKLVRIRAQVKNELRCLAMNQGLTKKRKLWSKAGR